MTDRLKELAEYILMSQVEDVEFLTVWEIMDDQMQDDPEYKKLTDEEQHQLALKIDKLCRSAEVTITFED
jgi:hypothetical protein